MSIQDRANGFGDVGAYLANVLRKYDVPVYGLQGSAPYDFGGVAASLYARFSVLRLMDSSLPLAAALLSLPFPLQCDVEDSDLLSLFYGASGVSIDYTATVTPSETFLCKFPGWTGKSNVLRRLTGMLISDKAFRHECFPRKKHPGAFIKGNIRLAPLLASLSSSLSPGLIGRLASICAYRFSEDVFASFLLYFYGLHHHVPAHASNLAYFLCINPDFAKSFSTAVKSLGGTATPLGCMLVESNTLQGRMSVPADLTGDIEYRLDPALVAEKTVNIPAADLRPHIRAIIKAELGYVELPDLDLFWKSRWGWCVNGSHSPASSDALGLEHSALLAINRQAYRRIAAEHAVDNPIPSWDGRVTVSVSEKLEHGKGRAIYACDTNSYFAFEYVLGPVQKAWKNRRVMLDPGAGGHSGISNRVRESFLRGGVNLMLDYDDFNSHHSSESMAAVIDEVCALSNVPCELRQKLVHSFDNTFLKFGGDWCKVAGTLMSGHRATTFINSVLNAAYLRAAWGAAHFDSLFTLHAGDDVYVRAPSLSSCNSLLVSAKDLGCRMNPAKQSIGSRTAEFLRMAITRDCTRGYYARSVASVVSGNWTSVQPLAPTESINTLVVSARSLVNRSGFADIAAVVADAARYTAGLPKKMLRSLCSGTSAWEGAPVFNTDGYVRTYRDTTTPPATAEFRRRLRSVQKNATTDYLTYVATELERDVMSSLGISLSLDMLATSYSKGLNIQEIAGVPRITYRRNRPFRARGLNTTTELLKKHDKPPALAHFTLLNLMKGQIPNDVLTEICYTLGLVPEGNVYEFCFGADPVSKLVLGTLSFADAAMLSKRADQGRILVLNPVYV